VYIRSNASHTKVLFCGLFGFEVWERGHVFLGKQQLVSWLLTMRRSPVITSEHTASRRLKIIPFRIRRHSVLAAPTPPGFG